MSVERALPEKRYQVAHQLLDRQPERNPGEHDQTLIQRSRQAPGALAIDQLPPDREGQKHANAERETDAAIRSCSHVCCRTESVNRR